MNNRFGRVGRPFAGTPRSDQKQSQDGGGGKQGGGAPHEEGGGGRSEEDRIRDDGYIESQPGGQRDDLMDKANQQNPRPNDISDPFEVPRDRTVTGIEPAVERLRPGGPLAINRAEELLARMRAEALKRSG